MTKTVSKKLLAEAGASLWEDNCTGDLPLHEVNKTIWDASQKHDLVQAVRSGRRDLVRWLLNLKVDQVDAQNKVRQVRNVDQVYMVGKVDKAFYGRGECRPHW